MHRNVILRATLTVVTIITLVAPATAQEPPPRTPPPPAGLIVGSTGSIASPTDKMLDTVGAFPTPPAPDRIASGALLHGTPPVPGRAVQYQTGEEAALAAMENFLHKHGQRNEVNQPTLVQAVVDGDATYGIMNWSVERIEGLSCLVGHRESNGDWQVSLLPIAVVDPVSVEGRSLVLPQTEFEVTPSPFSALPVTETLKGSAGRTLLDCALGTSIRYPHDWQAHVGNSHAPSLPRDALTFSSSPGVFDVTIVALKLSEEIAPIDVQDFARSVVMKFQGEVDNWTYLPSELPYQFSIRAVYTQPSYGYASVVFVADFLIVGEKGYWIFTQFASDDNSFVPDYEAGQQRLAVFQAMIPTFVALASPSGEPESILSTTDIDRLNESSQESTSPSATSASFVWPTTGYIGYIYNQPTSSGLHNGIDFWTRHLQ